MGTLSILIVVAYVSTYLSAIFHDLKCRVVCSEAGTKLVSRLDEPCQRSRPIRRRREPKVTTKFYRTGKGR